MTRILVIEDDVPLAEGLKDNFEFEGYDVSVAESGERGLERFATNGADVIVLDLMLPGMNGFDVLRALGHRPRPPRVIVLSARDAEADVVRALDLGAHDYVRKPFGLAELLARVRRQVQESGAPPVDDAVAFGDVRVSLRRFRLWKRGREALLSHLEVELLRLFLARPEEPLKRAEILRAAWGEDAYPSERTVDNFVLKLRKKVEDDPTRPRHLLTVFGYGYRFSPEPPPAANPEPETRA